MASVFTFEPDLPRVISPWLHVSEVSLARSSAAEKLEPEPMPKSPTTDHGNAKLVAEPQDGPVEYKLHLLLRPRRRLLASSTVLHVSGSHQTKARTTNRTSDTGTTLPPLSPLPTPTSQSRQNRLQNLTTQLLWRLQQSSPFHSSARSELVIPRLGDTKIDTVGPDEPGKPLSGLEESQGALYEIGVSDDGTLVGLTEDELEESLSTLVIMASSLGCKVNVTRRVTVGTCRWTEEPQASPEVVQRMHEELLWVAEAEVVPNLGSQKKLPMSKQAESDITPLSQTSPVIQDLPRDASKPPTEQLRVSLTGNTTSGKSSLLGTLSTSTLDNGRGKSRLSLLKHRHEIASGVTSSIVTELIGYHQAGVPSTINVMNFASGNISSWNDIHSACETNRLVVMTDSAGHPRYRRTTLRGLLSWAPHWTICCVGADDDEHDTGKTGATASSIDILGPTGANVDLSKSHLELCLALGLPLVIVITKLDLASSFGLRETLTKVLGILKAAGRQPIILSSPKGGGDAQNLQTIFDEDRFEVTETIDKIHRSGSAKLVPVVLTSAVTGAGICKLHALLHQLPLQPFVAKASHGTAHLQDCSRPDSLFHVDEVFTATQANSIALFDGSSIVNGHILSGHLSHGTLNIGDTALVGPFNSDTDSESFNDHKLHLAKSCPVLKNSSFAAPEPYDSQRSSSGFIAGRGSPVKESLSNCPVWRRVRVVSLRNLRLPVRRLVAEQVGTVGITYDDAEKADIGLRALPYGRIRKGMVVVRGSGNSEMAPPTPHRCFSATFEDRRMGSMTPGRSIIVYINSIRASAKILTVRSGLAPVPSDEVFELDDDSNDAMFGNGVHKRPGVEVAFEFLTSSEWFELGSEVLIMPERADAGSVGLEGFVGTTMRRPAGAQQA